MESLRGPEKNGGIASYFRRRRFILVVVAVVGLLLYVFRPQGPSRLLTHWSSGQVEETYGFLHLVLSERDNGLLSPELKLDLEGDNDVSLYEPEYSAARWLKERTRINQEYPIIVFSKSYCPYSKRAKDLLASLELQPPPKIIEVDLREDAQEIKQFLTRLTHHSTFPNILVKGESIGGSDNLVQLYSEKKLKPLFLKAGAKLKER